jgi:hypothetical protein
MPLTSPNASIIKGTGGYGSIFVTTSATYTGDFFSIQAVEDCIFLNLSSTDMQNFSEWVSQSVTLPAGMTIMGNFTIVTLSGKALLYKH